ncbi:MAG: CoA transferase, partial [Chloroflexota bacterium]
MLADVLERSGDAELAAYMVTFGGADPVLPTSFRLGEMGAATIAAAALAAARLWALRGGSAQAIHVDVDAAAAALRSSRYIRPATDTPPGGPRRGSGLGIYSTRDGRWMYFQRLFPHHRERLFRVLACADDEAAIARAVSGWEGLALEEAVLAAGATAGLVRTEAEWAGHPQGAALAGLPLLEILRVGDAPVQPLPAGERPLAGVRVLDVTRVLAGPTCGRTLAEHGADVLRIGSAALPDNEAMLQDTGHGKRSAALDLNRAEDAATLHQLIRGADVFSQGYRPGSLAARGFSAEEVMALRPGIIYVSVSAFGHQGPWAARRGFDSVVQAASGLADASAQEGVPRFLPANPLDYATGYLAAFGVMVALARRARIGGSWLVRLSLAQTGRWLASLPRIDAAQAAARPADLPK